MQIKRALLKTGISLLSIFLALLFGALLIILVGKNPLTAYGYLYKGAFSSMRIKCSVNLIFAAPQPISLYPSFPAGISRR